MSALKRRSLILAFILVFVFSMLPASLIAMDLEQEEIEEITIIESSSFARTDKCNHRLGALLYLG